MKKVLFPHLYLAQTPEERTVDDENATRVFLDSCKTTSGWQCPWCKQEFTDPTEFARHATTEANRLLEQFSDQKPRGPSPPGGT